MTGAIPVVGFPLQDVLDAIDVLALLAPKLEVGAVAARGFAVQGDAVVAPAVLGWHVPCRVLPHPPGPQSVTRRPPASSLLASATSFSRPIKLVSSSGRLSGGRFFGGRARGKATREPVLSFEGSPSGTSRGEWFVSSGIGGSGGAGATSSAGDEEESRYLGR